MNVHRTGVTKIVKAPNLVKKLVAGKYSVVVGGKEIQQLQLLGRYVNRLTAELKLIFLIC